jgi:phosphoribosyl 1,2-cyclic phosphodiesterase
MKVHFWGVRGSIPTPGPDTVKYGGNTSCVSITAGRKDDLVILDGGSGIRVLGIELMKKQFGSNGINPLEMSIFFSHVHWDHIQGIPFFKPMFIDGNKIHMYGEKKVRTSLETTLEGQQQYPNFPISLPEVSINGAEMMFTDLYAGQHIKVGNNILVHTTKLSHPDGVFCYRVEEVFANGVSNSIVYATDTEHRDVLDPRLLNIAENANVLIYDAQYTPDEYAGKVGIPKFDWGHSTYEHAVDMAIAAKVKHLILFHHDPEHTDNNIDKMEKAAEEYYNSKVEGTSTLVINAAFEGMEFEI